MLEQQLNDGVTCEQLAKQVEQLAEETKVTKAFFEQALQAAKNNVHEIKPLEMKINSMRAELDARFKGLDQRLMKLEAIVRAAGESYLRMKNT